MLMTLDHRRQHLQTLREGLSLLVAPIEFVVDLPAAIGHWVADSLASRQQLMEENARLHSQNLLMQARSLKNADLEKLQLGELSKDSLGECQSCKNAVLTNLDKLVVKPTNESGGYGILMGPQASPHEREATADAIRSRSRRRRPSSRGRT